MPSSLDVLGSPAERCHHSTSSLDCPVMISERNKVMENTDFGSSKKCIALSRRPLICGLFNIRSIRSKVCFAVESLAEHNLDLCITESWLLPSDVTIIGAALPSSYSFHHVPRSTDTGGGGGVGLIHSRALSNVRVVPKHMDVSSFEFLEITFSLHLQNIRMAILYHPGHPGTDRAFMEGVRPVS